MTSSQIDVEGTCMRCGAECDEPCCDVVFTCPRHYPVGAPEEKEKQAVP